MSAFGSTDHQVNKQPNGLEKKRVYKCFYTWSYFKEKGNCRAKMEP